MDRLIRDDADACRARGERYQPNPVISPHEMVGRQVAVLDDPPLPAPVPIRRHICDIEARIDPAAQHYVWLTAIRQHDVVDIGVFQQHDAHLGDHPPDVVFQATPVELVGGKWREDARTKFGTIFEGIMSAAKKDRRPGSAAASP
jgi:hypothetical protein